MMLGHADYCAPAIGKGFIFSMPMAIENATRPEDFNDIITPARLRNDAFCVMETPPAPRSPGVSDNSAFLSMCKEYTVCSNGGPHPFIVYTLLIPQKNQYIRVQKRFSTIKRLHHALLQENFVPHLRSLPRDCPWSFGGNKKSFVEERMVELNSYFRDLLSVKNIFKSNAFKYFLSKNDAFTPLEGYTLK